MSNETTFDTREEVDFVISSDPVEMPGITFQPLFDYEPMFVCAKGHRLADKPFIEARDFEDEILLHYPVERAKLDVFTQLLGQARIGDLVVGVAVAGGHHQDRAGGHDAVRGRPQGRIPPLAVEPEARVGHLDVVELVVRDQPVEGGDPDGCSGQTEDLRV